MWLEVEWQASSNFTYISQDKILTIPKIIHVFLWNN
jgi:hypothetical protein